MLVSIRRFESFDSDLLKDWSNKRGIIVQDSELPAYGWVASVDSAPVAMLFLRRIDHVAYLEGMITNSEESSVNRHLAMDNLIVSTIQWAKEFGIKNLIGFSVNEGIIERVKKLGFLVSPHTVVTMKLGE